MGGVRTSGRKAPSLPGELLALQSYIEDLIERIRETTDDDVERAIQTARDFIADAPTFSFDGIPGTLKVTDVQILESFLLQYRITLFFVSRNAGYGDRTGQAVLEVETPHTAVVTVVEDEAVSAVLDGQWDELKQVPIPPLDPDGTMVHDHGRGPGEENEDIDGSGHSEGQVDCAEGVPTVIPET